MTTHTPCTAETPRSADAPLTADTVRSDDPAGCRQRAHTEVERRNEAAMRRIYAEIFDEGRLELVDELIAPDAVNHTAPEGFRRGVDPIRGLVTMLRTAFPDCVTVVEETLPVGDTVIMRNWFEGTHLGPFLGHPPTGRRFRFRQIHWMRFGPDGRVVEHWGVRDDLTHLQQLGLIPA